MKVPNLYVKLEISQIRSGRIFRKWFGGKKGMGIIRTV